LSLFPLLLLLLSIHIYLSLCRYSLIFILLFIHSHYHYSHSLHMYSFIRSYYYSPLLLPFIHYSITLLLLSLIFTLGLHSFIVAISLSSLFSPAIHCIRHYIIIIHYCLHIIISYSLYYHIFIHIIAIIMLIIACYYLPLRHSPLWLLPYYYYSLLRLHYSWHMAFFHYSVFHIDLLPARSLSCLFSYSVISRLLEGYHFIAHFHIFIFIYTLFFHYATHAYIFPVFATTSRHY